ncbi:hypothetical protein D3C81_1815130 [compost metagenome]
MVLHGLSRTRCNGQHLTNHIQPACFQLLHLVQLPHVVSSTFVHAAHELSSFLQQKANRFQLLVGCRDRARSVPNYAGRTPQSVEDAPVCGPLQHLFQLVWGEPASLFVVLQLFLESVEIHTHLKRQAGDPTLVIATGAVERLLEG